MPRQIVAAELSHENAPAHIRRKLAFNEIAVRAHLIDLSTRMDEVFILSSSSRFAVYGVHEDVSQLVKFFSRDKDIAPYVNYFTNTEESIHHFYATAGGLCGNLKGERQILDQIKQAHQLGLESESVGLIMDNLLREGMKTGERVQKEAAIDRAGTSVLNTGFTLLEECLSNSLYRKVFLVLGTGKTVKLALDRLYHHSAPNVFIASNDDVRSYDLAERYNARAVSMNHVRKYFSVADVIIVDSEEEQTGSFSDHVIDFDLNKKRIVLNFGAPDNFNNAFKSRSDIELYNVDDLKAMRPSGENYGGLGEAWEIVMEETQNFVGILRHLEISPILAAYWNKIIDIKTRELDWMLPRLGDVSECDKELVKKYTRKLIRSTAQGCKSPVSVEAIKHLYGLYNINLNFPKN